MACKNWNRNGASQTKNTGSHQNPLVREPLRGVELGSAERASAGYGVPFTHVVAGTGKTHRTSGKEVLSCESAGCSKETGPAGDRSKPRSGTFVRVSGGVDPPGAPTAVGGTLQRSHRAPSLPGQLPARGGASQVPGGTGGPSGSLLHVVVGSAAHRVQGSFHRMVFRDAQKEHSSRGVQQPVSHTAMGFHPAPGLASFGKGGEEDFAGLAGILRASGLFSGDLCGCGAFQGKRSGNPIFP